MLFQPSGALMPILSYLANQAEQAAIKGAALGFPMSDASTTSEMSWSQITEVVHKLKKTSSIGLLIEAMVN